MSFRLTQDGRFAVTKTPLNEFWRHVLPGQHSAALAAVVMDVLWLPTIVERMITNDESWEAVRAFCEKNISQQEAAE
ncbi:hypothetical protein EVAR_5250_1 [Eumeta japonica]|uniref:Uncharacterized protein n=1 Tax=Eumeta variegata TaxID=151549 RepID=A0A4C1XR82_EUMVA|nr:hypothetical protein EVAR_5250_1 [Eumeta japonica]